MMLLIRLRDDLAGAGVRLDWLYLRELLELKETFLLMSTSSSGRSIEGQM